MRENTLAEWGLRALIWQISFRDILLFELGKMLSYLPIWESYLPWYKLFEVICLTLRLFGILDTSNPYHDTGIYVLYCCHPNFGSLPR